MLNPTVLHEKINLRALLVESITVDGQNRYGGKGNATVSSKSFKVFAGMKANYLVNGLDQLRNR